MRLGRRSCSKPISALEAALISPAATAVARAYALDTRATRSVDAPRKQRRKKTSARARDVANGQPRWAASDIRATIGHDRTQGPQEAYY